MHENQKEGQGVRNVWLLVDGNATEVVVRMTPQHQEVTCGPLSYPTY